MNKVQKEQLDNINMILSNTKDCGANGKVLELIAKMYFGSNSVTVSPKGKIDIRKKINGKMCNLELKSRGAELYNNNDYKSYDKWKNNDYVVYSIYKIEKNKIYSFEEIKEIADTFKVFTLEEFEQLTSELKLVRTKASTSQYDKKREGMIEKVAIDKVTLQSPPTTYKSNPSRYRAFVRLMEYGEILDDFVDKNNIRIR